MKWRLGGVLQPARQTNTNSKGKKSTVICGCKVACHYDLQPLIEKKQIGKETLFGRLKTQGSRKGGYEKWRSGGRRVACFRTPALSYACWP